MAMLPDMFTSSRTHEVVLEPVVRAGMEAIKVHHFLVRILFSFYSYSSIIVRLLVVMAVYLSSIPTCLLLLVQASLKRGLM